MKVKFTRIVADENVPKEVVDHLKGMEFKEVYWILEKKSGISDPDVWNLAASKGAVLLTDDLGFVSQLNEKDILEGPELVEYSTRGFTNHELRDPRVMRGMIEWIFMKEHPGVYDHIKIHVEGSVKSKKQRWGEEKARRRKRQ